MNTSKAKGSGACIALRNGRLADVERGRYFDQGVSLVLKDGRIQAMPGLAGEPSLDELSIDATIDLDGRAALPGLINSHAHIHLKLPAFLLGLKDMKLTKKFGRKQLHKEMSDCLSRGITTIRDCVTDDLRDTQELRAAIESGEIDGPRVVQAILLGQLGSTWTPKRGLKSRFQNWAAGMPFVEYDDPASGLIAFDPEADESQVRAAVDEAIDVRGADVIKMYEQRGAKVTFEPVPLMKEEQLIAIADQARARGVPSTIHHVHVESLRRAMKARPTSIAHVPIDEVVTEADLDLLTDLGIPIEPTMSVAYGFCWDLPGTDEKHRDALRSLAELRDETFRAIAEEYWIPELQPSVIAGIERARAGQTKIMGFMDLSAALRFHVGYISIGAQNLRKFFERGVPIGCGNDGGVPPCTVSMVRHELTVLEHCLNGDGETRFTAEDAVRTVTIQSAKALGKEDELGSLERGKLADVVIFDGDPLDDMTLLGAPAAAVFKEGALVRDLIGLSESL